MTSSFVRSLAVLAVLTAAISCDDPAEPVTRSDPASIEVVGAVSVDVVAGEAAAVPLAVRVADADGRPLEGVAVAWRVTGSVATLSDSVATTDADGIATTSIAPATTASRGLIHATVDALEATFGVTIGAGEPDTVIVWGGNAQRGVVGARLPLRLVIQAFDRFHNPVAGAPVTWPTTERSGVIQGSTETDSTGVALAHWFLDSAAGDHSGAVVVGDLAPLPLSARADSLRFERIAADSVYRAGSRNTVRLRLTYPDGTPVSEVFVEWSIAGEGATIASDSLRPSGEGFVQNQLSLSGSLGAVTLIARAGAFVEDLSFTIVPDVPSDLTLSPASTVLLAPEDSVAGPFVVTLTDRFGNPIPGHLITWSDGSGTLQPVEPATDSLGQARAWWIGENDGVVSASVGTLYEWVAVDVIGPRCGESGVQLQLGVAHSESLAADDCIVASAFGDIPAGAYVDVFRLTIAETDGIGIWVEGLAGATPVIVADRALGPPWRYRYNATSGSAIAAYWLEPGEPAQIPPGGAYLFVSAESPGTVGSYQVVPFVYQRTCAPYFGTADFYLLPDTTIVVQDSLTLEDCRGDENDLDDPLHDRWEVSIHGGTTGFAPSDTINFSLTSDDFVPTLTIHYSGEELPTTTSADGQTITASIPHTGHAGHLHVRVSSDDGKTRGAYTLRLDTLDPPAP